MIKGENIVKIFDKKTVLNVSKIEIKEGSVFGIVGSNGAGKSTLLRNICGIYKPTEGEITIDGEKVYNNPTAKSKLVFVSDDPYFLPGADIRRMAKLYKAVYRDFDAEKMNHMCDDFKLPKNKSINTFSKGMKRQAAIILAFCCNAKYMIFDETFDGLDPVMRNFVKSIIFNEISSGEKTVIVSSHSLRELSDLCDSLMMLHEGKTVLETSLCDIDSSFAKFQVSFDSPFDEADFSDIDMLDYSKIGSIATLIARGNSDEIKSKLSAKSPTLLESVPLNLDEIFICELKHLGYDFSDAIRKMSDE